jgi:hypothetical protein
MAIFVAGTGDVGCASGAGLPAATVAGAGLIEGHLKIRGECHSSRVVAVRRSRRSCSLEPPQTPVS